MNEVMVAEPIGAEAEAEAEVDWPVPSPPESGFCNGGTGCERPTAAPSRRWRERSPARKRAYNFGVCRSSMAIFGELKV